MTWAYNFLGFLGILEIDVNINSIVKGCLM